MLAPLSDVAHTTAASAKPCLTHSSHPQQGMGEPLNNYQAVRAAATAMTDNRRFGMRRAAVTISTVGVIPRILSLPEDLPGLSLALSLHAPTQELRESIVPSARAYKLEKLMAAVASYQQRTKQKVAAQPPEWNCVRECESRRFLQLAANQSSSKQARAVFHILVQQIGWAAKPAAGASWDPAVGSQHMLTGLQWMMRLQAGLLLGRMTVVCKSVIVRLILLCFAEMQSMAKITCTPYTQLDAIGCKFCPVQQLSSRHQVGQLDVQHGNQHMLVPGMSRACSHDSFLNR